MWDDDVPPWDRPRRFAHWDAPAGVEPADDGPRRGPILTDWPMPGEPPRLHVVPDPEPEATPEPVAAPEAVQDAPGPMSGRYPTNADGSPREGWWQGGDPPVWVDRPKPSRLDLIRAYLRQLVSAEEADIAKRERRREADPWDL